MNPYPYVLNNPLKYVDPLGLSAHIPSVMSDGGGWTGCNITNDVASNLTLTKDMKNAGVKIITIDGKQYYDYSEPINKIVLDNTKLVLEIRKNNPYPIKDPAGIFWFMNQVKPRAVWDLKIPERWKAALPGVPYLGEGYGDFSPFVLNGEKITAEDLGNITYGYWGRALGYDETFIFWGAGYAQLHGSEITLSNLMDKRLTEAPLYGDNEDDHQMIIKGIEWYNSTHPEDKSYTVSGNPTKELRRLIIGPVIE